MPAISAAKIQYWADKKRPPKPARIPREKKVRVKKERVHKPIGHRILDRYILVKMPDHPASGKNGYVLEHRLVMESVLGRYLRSDEHVHHINADRTDNRKENLEILSPSEHGARHSAERKRRA
jgi:hypothetical protein